jgi:hypothetical protein
MGKKERNICCVGNGSRDSKLFVNYLFVNSKWVSSGDFYLEAQY